MIKFDGKKTGIFAAGVALVQQVSRFLQVKMQRNYTQTAQQPFYVQRHV